MLQENYSENSVNILSSSCGKGCVSFYKKKKENVSDNSSRQHGIRAQSDAERPRFPFTGKPGINLDLEDHSNPLEYPEFCISEMWNSQTHKSSCANIFGNHA
jgi:hypothetical protein